MGNGVLGMMKKLIGLAVLTASAIAWVSAADASTLSFNLQTIDFSYSWLMDDHPTPVDADTFVGKTTATVEFTGQAMGTSLALPAGELLFFSISSHGGLAFEDQATGNILIDLYGDQIYSGLETSPYFHVGNFAVFKPFTPDGYGTLTVAATPIPAALPLFVSALGGLGFIAWKRRRAGQA